MDSTNNSATNDQAPKKKCKRGFASMTPEQRSRISSLGGIAVHRRGVGYKFNSEAAKVAGEKGRRSRYGKKEVVEAEQ